MKPLPLSLMSVVLLVFSSSTALAQDEITLVAPGGARAAMEQLIPQFESKTGHKVKPTFGSGQGTKQQVARGDTFDVVVLQPPYEEVLHSGNVVANTATTLASVSVGVAVKQGAPKPDISTPQAVKKMLLSAKAVSYPDPTTGATAGASFEQALKNLGIAEQMQPKLKRARGGAGAMELVAKGEVDIGLTFLSEMTEPGIDVVGPLPRQICPPTTLVGFISTHAKHPATAKELLRYISSPTAKGVYKAQRMEPAR